MINFIQVKDGTAQVMNSINLLLTKKEITASKPKIEEFNELVIIHDTYEQYF